MEANEALSELSQRSRIFPHEAMLWAMDHLEEMTPALLEILEDAWADPDVLFDRLTEPELTVDYYALYLLAQARERRAYPLIVDFFSNPDKRVFELMQDLIFEDLGRILATVCHGDVGPIKRLVENETLNVYVAKRRARRPAGACSPARDRTA